MVNTRYVVYVQPAKENLEALDGSLESTIRSKCESFLDAWRPSDVFEKPVAGPVKQIKKNRTVMRAFGAHWSGSDTDILLVIAIYKKGSERSFWRRKDDFQSTAEDYFEVLDRLDEDGQIQEWISRAKTSDDFLVYGID